MTYVPTHVAVAAAAARRKREQEEEEKMTMYEKNDLNGWEFKIVRSATGSFKKPERVQDLCREEARSGWEMLEKFDDSRIRFKRRIDRRSTDSHAEIDPYRTSVGISEFSLAMIILSIVFWTVGAVLITVFIVKEGFVEMPASLILPALIILAVALLVFLKLKGRH